MADSKSTLSANPHATDTSVAIMAIPRNAEDLPGTEAEKHLTLVYLGHFDSDGAPELANEETKQQVLDVVSKVAEDVQPGPLTFNVVQIAPLGVDGAQVWMLEAPGPTTLRGMLLNEELYPGLLNGLMANGTFTRYEDYLPHVTIGYGELEDATADLEAEANQVTEITFDTISVWWGTERWDFPFGGPREDDELPPMPSDIVPGALAVVDANSNWHHPSTGEFIDKPWNYDGRLKTLFSEEQQHIVAGILGLPRGAFREDVFRLRKHLRQLKANPDDENLLDQAWGKAADLRDKWSIAEVMTMRIAGEKNPLLPDFDEVEHVMNQVEKGLEYLETAVMADNLGIPLDGSQFGLLHTSRKLRRSQRPKPTTVKTLPSEPPSATVISALLASGGTDMSKTTAAPGAATTTKKVKWEGPIAFEGKFTGDNRVLLPGSIDWSNIQFPQPFRWAAEDVGMHDGARVIGNIHGVTRLSTGTLWGWGTFDMKSELGREAQRHVEEELTTGVSLDLDRISAEVADAGALRAELAQQLAQLDLTDAVPDMNVTAIKSARNRSATLLALPAFEGARVKAVATWSHENGTLEDGQVIERLVDGTVLSDEEAAEIAMGIDRDKAEAGVLSLRQRVALLRVAQTALETLALGRPSGIKIDDGGNWGATFSPGGWKWIPMPGGLLKAMGSENGENAEVERLLAEGGPDNVMKAQDIVAASLDQIEPEPDEDGNDLGLDQLQAFVDADPDEFAEALTAPVSQDDIDTGDMEDEDSAKPMPAGAAPKSVDELAEGDVVFESDTSKGATITGPGVINAEDGTITYPTSEGDMEFDQGGTIPTVDGGGEGEVDYAQVEELLDRQISAMNELAVREADGEDISKAYEAWLSKTFGGSPTDADRAVAEAAMERVRDNVNADRSESADAQQAAIDEAMAKPVSGEGDIAVVDINGTPRLVEIESIDDEGRVTGNTVDAGEPLYVEDPIEALNKAEADVETGGEESKSEDLSELEDQDILDLARNVNSFPPAAVAELMKEAARRGIGDEAAAAAAEDEPKDESKDGGETTTAAEPSESGGETDEGEPKMGAGMTPRQIRDQIAMLERDARTWQGGDSSEASERTKANQALREAEIKELIEALPEGEPATLKELYSVVDTDAATRDQVLEVLESYRGSTYINPEHRDLRDRLYVKLAEMDGFEPSFSEGRGGRRMWDLGNGWKAEESDPSRSWGGLMRITDDTGKEVLTYDRTTRWFDEENMKGFIGQLLEKRAQDQAAANYVASKLATKKSRSIVLAQQRRREAALRKGNGENWVEQTGTGKLPPYIRDIADALMEKGMDESQAIATAVNTVERWAAGGPARKGGEGSVSKETQAKAQAAIAEWEAKKAEAKADNLSVQSSGMEYDREGVAAGLTSLVASGGTTRKLAAPIKPPKEWFADPQFKMGTPLTVTKEGRVFGHLALWGTCHAALGGAAGNCVTVPKSTNDYAMFHLGVVECEDGTEVPVGRLAMETGHANDTFGSRAAIAHYENTGLAIADLHCGEDTFGVWVSGALRPDATDAQIRALKASPLSGDWRHSPSTNNLELVMALAVNMPGFAVPRPQFLVASGAVRSLTAAGMVPPKQVSRKKVEAAMAGDKLALDDLRYLKALANREREHEAAQLRQRALVASGMPEKIHQLAATLRTQATEPAKSKEA